MENVDTECNKRPPQSTANKAIDKRELCKQMHKERKLHHDEIRIDQQETGQAILFLGHCDINQVEMFTTSATRMMLLIGHNYINETGIFTLAHL